MLLLCKAVIWSSAWAHQPVMDMAPRWAGGYGLQLRYETYGSDDLLHSDSGIPNPLGREERFHKTWLEGVYTFERSRRLTLKIPYVDQSKTVVQDGAPLKLTANGWGDLIVGFPLKKYTNADDFTYNLSFTPSLRLPTGSVSGDFPVSDGSWDLGLSFSYSSETYKFYQLYDLFYWINGDGKEGMDEGNELGLDVNLGIHPYHNNASNTGLFLMWDLSARHREKGMSATGISGGSRIHSGPVLVLYRGKLMFRSEYKFPLYEKVAGAQLSRGPELSIALGIVW